MNGRSSGSWSVSDCRSRVKWISVMGDLSRSILHTDSSSRRHRRQGGVLNRLQGRHHFAGEELHVFLRQVSGQRAELEQPEQVADAQLLAVFQQLLLDRLRAADDRIRAFFNLLPR